MDALYLPGSIRVLNPVPLDSVFGPYANVAAAKAAVPLGMRYDGLTVQITGSGNYEWKQADLTDTGLVAKGASISMNTARMLGRTTAGVGVPEEITVSNGLTLSAPGTTTLKLGGALTGTTTFTGSSPLIFSNFATSGAGRTFVINPTLTLSAASDGIMYIGPALTMSVANANGSNTVLFENTSSFGANSAKHSIVEFGGSMANGGFTGTILIGYNYHPNVTAAIHYAMILNSGNVGFNTTQPTALLHLGQAVSATAGTAPLKFAINGTLLSSIENGAIEVDSSHIYFSIGGSRYQLDQQSGGAQRLDQIIAANTTATINNAANAIEWQWNTLGAGTGLKLSTSSTAAASNTQKLLELSSSGANNSQTTYGLHVTNTHSGTTTTNVAGHFTASGATTNIGLNVPLGQVRLGAVGINVLAGVGASQVAYLEISDSGTPGITIGRTTGVYTSIFMSGATTHHRVSGGGGTTIWSYDYNTGNHSWMQVAQSTTHTAFTWTQAIHTGGSPTGWAFVGGAHTTLATTAEATDWNLNLNRTVQWATGTVALERFARIQIGTVGFVASSTMTRAVGLAISGAVKAGTNATIGTSIGLEIEGQALGSGVNNSYGLVINASSGASVSDYALGVTGNIAVNGLTFLGGSMSTIPHHTLEVAGSFGLQATTPNPAGAGTSPSAADCVILADASGGTYTVTLPTGADIYRRIYYIKKIDSTSNNVVISGGTIDGASNITINTQYSGVMIINGTGTDVWYVLSTF